MGEGHISRRFLNGSDNIGHFLHAWEVVSMWSVSDWKKQASTSAVLQTTLKSNRWSKRRHSEWIMLSSPYPKTKARSRSFWRSTLPECFQGQVPVDVHGSSKIYLHYHRLERCFWFMFTGVLVAECVWADISTFWAVRPVGRDVWDKSQAIPVFTLKSLHEAFKSCANCSWNSPPWYQKPDVLRNHYLSSFWAP